ncbi:MAG: DUF58 domain-containing protein, partial [Bacteroidales bacterium]|nr:DUF58 domain-containing protein [Bacteroidales bacterium]
PEEKGTDIAAALQFLTNAIKKKCTAFLLSDMIDVDSQCNPRYEDALKVAADRHDISVINIYDRREREIPSIGLVNVMDAESGRQMWVDTSSKAMRASYEKWNADVREKTRQVLLRYRVDSVDIATDQDYVKGLISLFKHRA